MFTDALLQPDAAERHVMHIRPELAEAGRWTPSIMPACQTRILVPVSKYIGFMSDNRKNQPPPGCLFHLLMAARINSKYVIGRRILWYIHMLYTVSIGRNDKGKPLLNLAIDFRLPSS
jgi:hypothetical protein